MKKILKKIRVLTLTLIMALTMVSYTNVKAEDSGVVVTTESELRAAVANGGKIILGNSIILEDAASLTIRKDVTLVLNEYSITHVGREGVTAVLDIADCTVNIIGNSDSYSTSSRIGFDFFASGNDLVAIKLSNISNNTKLVIDGSCYEGSKAAIEMSSLDGYTTELVVDNGYFSTTGEKVFYVDGKNSTKITLNGGRYRTTLEDISSYIGEEKEIFESTDTVEIGSSVWSDEFKAITAEGKIKAPFTNKYDPNNYAPNEKNSNMLMVYLDNLKTEDVEYGCEFGDDPTKVVITLLRKDNTGYMVPVEKHNVEVVYLNSVNSTVESEIQGYIDELSAQSGQTYLVKDMEMINLWVNGFDHSSYSAKMYSILLNCSGEVRNLLGNSNVSIDFFPRAGDGSDLWLYSKGPSVFVHEGIYYDTYSMRVMAQNILYVPDNTGKTSAELIAAAQARVDEYLGENGKVVISEGGKYSDLQYWENDWQILESYNPNLCLDGVEYYFIATVNGVEHKVLIVPDSEQMIVKPGKDTVDIKTNIQISIKVPDIPLDTAIQVKPLTEGKEYDKVVDILKVKENVTYDLKLYSELVDKYITTTDNGTFEVKIPIPTGWGNKELAVYYVDDNGKITEHAVTKESGYVKFITDHFSIYTLAEKIAFNCSLYGANHKFTAIPAKEPTTKEEGCKAHWICECGKMYADAEGKVEIVDKSSLIVPKIPVEESPDEEDTFNCPLYGTNHKLIAVPAKEATTKEEGCKAHWICECGKIYADAEGKVEIEDKSSLVVPKIPADASPNTGDTFNLSIVILLLFISVVGISLHLNKKNI